MAERQDNWSATEYNNTASFVYSDKFTRPVLDLLQPAKSQRILDLGCGSGELTKALMDVVGPEGYVLGLDSSRNMIDKAISNGVVDVRVMDVQKIAWEYGSSTGLVEHSFDAVFTNAALHWCKESPTDVVKNAWSALKPQGRFVGEMGGFTNLCGLRLSLHRVLRRRGHDPRVRDPWYFPSDTAYKGMLESVGFNVETIGLYPRLTPVPNGLKAWLDLFVRRSMLSDLSDAEADEILDEVVKECEVDMRDEEGNWHIMYVRLRWKATKPAA
ncbi:SubName: Full=Uncharacterized protein {ECO:0000313/EMBL:CCA72535.1} [Serendipita indica DSM 11827]|uniref:Methyltransferase type 11 domain-containing protein n=1 Tax=Serendipita indica (strain DSM 11827) TaxID=1109443 RepID=G4TMI6_SERID|nr:SubName: Full=Uncharacterized protein {ECO:0000313/EMBL:CCA72535.1} [Serendipita indica DSM 11827]CCA72535.1 hypothetical protein PIIN_06472 [Serendipita indica DSM 11827]